MRGVTIALLAACLCLTRADRLSFPLQDYVVSTGSGLHGAVLFARDEPRLTAFVDSSDLQDPEEDSSAWLDSELSGDFDGGFQTWLDQQLGMLQALVVPQRGSPCGGARMAYLHQDDPSLSYMASSRFGPAVLTTVMQQIDSFRPDLEVPDLEVQRVDLQEIPAWESVFDGEGSQVAEEQPRSAQQFPDWLSGQEAAGQQAEVSLPRTLFSSLTVQNKGQDADQEKFEAGPLFSEGQSWEGHPPPPPPPHTSCADMMTFAVLAIGCIMVWGYLLRSYLSCSRALKKGEAARAAEFTHNPLLAPLVREDSYSVQDVAVAAAEVPQGSYYVPQGSQYVQVAYAPLSSER